MRILTRAIKAAWDEVSKPEGFVKGEEFERFIRRHLFPNDNYDLLHRTHDYTSNKNDYIESSKGPDFKLRSREFGKEFFVEAKYRSGFYKGAVEWCTIHQLRRYQAINKKTPVYVVIGVGQQPGSPERVYLVPLKRIRYTRLFHSFLSEYKIPAHQCVKPSKLLSLL